MLKIISVLMTVGLLLIRRTNSLTSTVVRRCTVAEFKVQQNFELEQYEGTWYDIANVRREGLPQKQVSNYTLDGDGGLFMLSDGLNINGECFKQKVLAHGKLVQPGRREGKFRIKIKDVGLDEVDATSNDYWVVQTDYTSYAVVYSCQLYLDDGTCSYNHTSAWLLSREATLEPVIYKQMVKLLEDLCISEERIIPTSQHCIETVQDLTNQDAIDTNEMTENEECIVTDVSLQKNIDFQRYMGTWYEIAKKRTPAKYEVPDSTTTVLRMIDNNTIAMELNLFRVSNRCMGVTVNGVAKTDGAKWMVTFDAFNGRESKTAPYWIVDTDYENYALIYGCNSNEYGDCSYRNNIVYVMGRQSELSQIYMDKIKERLPSLCIDIHDIIRTKPEACHNSTTENEPACLGDRSNVENLDIKKLHGEWFAMARQMETDGVGSFPKLRTLSILTSPQIGDVQMVLKGVQLSGVCVDQEIVASVTIPVTDYNTGMLSISFPRWLADYDIPIEVKYRIVHTDNNNILVMYACQELNEDGSCQNKGSLLVFSRSRTSAVTSSDMMWKIASSLCIDRTQFEFVEGTCADQTEENQAVNGNTVSDFSPVPQSLPSLHVTPRKCNPTKEAYGCCTLIDAPAVGPNGEGCPSFQGARPPVFQLPQPAPVGKVEQGECWHERQIAIEDGATTNLTCNQDGTYNEVQCDMSLGACWCVNQKTGQRKPGSLTTNAERPDCRYTNCQRHRKRIEGYQSRKNMKKKYFYRPNCENDGTYRDIQCFNRWKYCWCVDRETGKKIPGTLAMGMLPICEFDSMKKNNFGQ